MQDITIRIGTVIMKLSKRGFLHYVVVLVVVLVPSVNPARNDPYRRFLAQRIFEWLQHCSNISLPQQLEFGTGIRNPE